MPSWWHNSTQHLSEWSSPPTKLSASFLLTYLTVWSQLLLESLNNFCIYCLASLHQTLPLYVNFGLAIKAKLISVALVVPSPKLVARKYLLHQRESKI